MLILGYLYSVVIILVNSKTLVPMLPCNEHINRGKHHTFQGKVRSSYYEIYFLHHMNFILCIGHQAMLLIIYPPLFTLYFLNNLHFFSSLFKDVEFYKSVLPSSSGRKSAVMTRFQAINYAINKTIK